jgi:methylphosphotriester-DNA--protein-cysteine methyltransferase
MWSHHNLSSSNLFRLLKTEQISLAGNQQLKIFGTLSCSSGKKMKSINRVFFRDEAEALSLGYRPCGHCLRKKFKLWKSGFTS